MLKVYSTREVTNVRLKEATIFGFGKWVDYTIDFTDHNFICIYGDNESGKTTIQQFLLFMLFGMPPKKRADYRPKTSSKMGGRLTVEDPEAGTYTIERLHDVRNGKAVCYTPDGNEHGETWLQERLNGMTKETYQSIFTFSAVDLLDIRHMKEDDVGEVLLGIGMTGSNSIHTLEKQLEAELGDLFKPFGKKPTINQQLTSMDTLYSSLQEYRETKDEYRTKREKLNQLTTEMEQLQVQLDEAKDAVFRLDKKLQAFPVLKDYQKVKEQYQSYPEQLTFPENGIERLEQLNEYLMPMKSELSVLQHNLEEYKTKQDAIRNDFYHSDVYEQLETIIQRKQNWLDCQQELHRYEEAIQKLAWQIGKELNQLDAGISVDDLTSLQLPFSAEKIWNQVKRDNDQIVVMKEQLEREHKQLLKEQAYLNEQKDKLQASLTDEAQEHALQETIRQYHHEEHMQWDLAEQTNQWDQLKQRKEKNALNWLVVGIAMCVALMVAAFMQGAMYLWGIAGIIFFVSIGQWAVRKQSFREFEKMFTSKRPQSGQVTEEMKREAEQLLSESEQKKQELSIVQDKLQSNEMEILKWEEKQSGLNQRENRLNKQIADQYRQYPFLERIEIAYWPAFYHTLKHVLDLQQDKEQQEWEYDKRLQESKQFENWTERTFRDMNWEDTGKSVEDKLADMEHVLQKYRDDLARMEQYDQWIAETEARRRQIQKKMRVYEEALTQLMTVAGTDTQEEYLKKGKQLKEKQEYANRMSELDNQLARILPGDDYETFITMELSEEHVLKSAYESESDRISELERTIEKKRELRADMNAELAALETSESYSEALHRFTIEQEKLEHLAEEWAVLKAAKEMLTETKRNYRRNYMGQVTEKTTYYFHQLTQKAYNAIYPPEENKPFRVEAKDGIRYDVNELSQATIDQLYVSLRLGISEVMSEKHRLPFIIDDAFVHFDPARTKQVIALLSEVSQRQQIILFTCKTSVVEAATNVSLIESDSSVRIPLP
ncbi:AAA family ATPase [Lentibacillus cibarius]|uniref:AAA family ATPase n=1 Tax=Lentibacillus cibarius TaxID=2583219 RepID=A0A549YIX9_9BACI|nr:AAA family ATPase [Lentibacillus cibarius]